MTTASSPPDKLRKQAAEIASRVKHMVPPPGRSSLKFAVVMDDKVLSITMPWPLILNTDQAALAEYVFDKMREAKDVAN